MIELQLDEFTLIPLQLEQLSLCSEENLTKRLELLFLVVLALPNASRIGLNSNNCCSRVPCPPARPAMVAKY